jgi:lipopolysaccharide transport system ATP-binding protein
MYVANKLDHSGSIMEHISSVNPGMEIESVTVNGSSSDELRAAAGTRSLTIEIAGKISRPMRLEVEARVYDVYETPLAFFSPGHEKGYIDVHPAGRFRLVRCTELPRMMRGDYYLHLYITDPGVAGWVSIPRAVRIVAEGTPTATGYVFDYYNGNGWVLLSEVENPV